MKKNRSNNKVKKKRSNTLLFPFLLLIATLFMGIGYAAINLISFEISGTASADVQEGVFITDVTLDSNQNANLENSKINTYHQTMLYSSIELSPTDPDSYITYNVTIYNSTDNRVVYTGTNFDELFYTDNNNNFNSSIVFEVTGINDGEALPAKESKTIQIKFKYTGTDLTQNILNSYVNFNFNEVFTVTYFEEYNSSYPKYALENEDLIIDMSTEVFESFIIKINDSVTTDYTYENNILTIPKVSGDVYIEGVIGTPKSYFEFDEPTKTITGFTEGDYAGTVVIPDTINGVAVEVIGEGVFDHSDITGVIIGNNIKVIGAQAFQYSSKLETVVIPEGVTTIEESAFRDCYNVKEYNLPNTVTSIGDNAFRENRTITNFVIPDSVITVGTWALAGCSNLETVTIGSGVTSIGTATFSYDPALTTIYINSGSTLVIPSNRWGASSSVTFINR